MLTEEMIKEIDKRAKMLNEYNNHSDDIASMIHDINQFIEGKCELSSQQIHDIMHNIIIIYTTSHYIPLDIGIKFLRARAYGENYLETQVSKLSYIAEKESYKVQLGRLNKEKQPVYYGCIYFGNEGGVNVAFSESGAESNARVNVIHSRSTSVINVHFVGIYDHVHRQCKPIFMSQETFDFYKSAYEYRREKFTDDLFLAYLLCDTFLSDILRKKDSINLYKVTSQLFSISCQSPDVDGIVYTSVKSEGDPVIALKTKSVDNKVEHTFCNCYKIISDYGYAKYKAIKTHNGRIHNGLISWTESNT